MNILELLSKLEELEPNTKVCECGSCVAEVVPTEQWEKLDKIRDEVFGPENFVRGAIMFKSHIREGQILGETENLVLIKDPYFN